jgi:hypothetical protein
LIERIAATLEAHRKEVLEETIALLAREQKTAVHNANTTESPMEGLIFGGGAGALGTAIDSVRALILVER